MNAPFSIAELSFEMSKSCESAKQTHHHEPNLYHVLISNNN
ncbi:MAG: hypothetical protein JWM28_1623 [Chitinophagaceae bacterium]|nr:hypothetical protein [Chitinophagaceae bacterium]